MLLFVVCHTFYIVMFSNEVFLGLGIFGWLTEHTGSKSSSADFNSLYLSSVSLGQRPSCSKDCVWSRRWHCLLSRNVMFIYVLLFANEVVRERSLGQFSGPPTKVGNHCSRGYGFWRRGLKGPVGPLWVRRLRHLLINPQVKSPVIRFGLKDKAKLTWIDCMKKSQFWSLTIMLIIWMVQSFL